jgi:hypothetical protein
MRVLQIPDFASLRPGNARYYPSPGFFTQSSAYLFPYPAPFSLLIVL